MSRLSIAAIVGAGYLAMACGLAAGRAAADEVVLSLLQAADEAKPEAAPAAAGETTEQAADSSAVDIPRTAPVELGPKFIRLNLHDGSVISGDLSVSEVSVDTAFGKLVVPIAKIRSFTPGLDSRPEQMAHLSGLVEKLGSDDYKTREQAHKDLAAMGMKIRRELAEFGDSDNAEIKRHVGEILKELDAQAEEAGDDDEATTEKPWIREDTVVTTDFTVIGKVSPAEFTIQSKYGPLNIALADVVSGVRDLGTKEPFRRNVTVDGSNIAQRSFKSTGVRVEAGDKIVVNADGNVVMSPWGSNAMAGPDGAPNYGWYVPNQIPGGALVAKIGDKGTIFKVGRQMTFTAKNSGVLQLAIGIQAEYANEGYQYPGQFNVKLKIEPK